MRWLMIVAAAAVSMTGGNSRAAAIPNAGMASAAREAVPLQKAQYAWGGRNFCWYGNGWQGPGWYWCGYAWRSGFGWGGGAGWNGWAGRGVGWRGGVWHGGGWHGGGWHGGVRHGGGWHGGRGFRR